jgi:hypothetical protein
MRQNLDIGRQVIDLAIRLALCGEWQSVDEQGTQMFHVRDSIRKSSDGQPAGGFRFERLSTPSVPRK